jgi:hypothetical protein
MKSSMRSRASLLVFAGISTWFSWNFLPLKHYQHKITVIPKPNFCAAVSKKRADSPLNKGCATSEEIQELYVLTRLRIRDVLSRNPDLGSWFLSIPNPDYYHPGSGIQQGQQKRRGEKFVVLSFFVATNFTELKIMFFTCTKNKWANWKKIKVIFFYSKRCL